MINLRKILIKNTFYLALSEGISMVILFLISVLVARNLGDTVYGQFAFVLAFAQIWQVIADFGLTMIAVREISTSSQNTSKLLNNLLSLKIIIGLATYILIFASAFIIHKPFFIKELILIAGLYLIIYTTAELLRAVFRAQEKFKYEAFVKITQHLLLFILIAIAINSGNLIFIIWSYVIAASYALGLTIYLIYKKITHLSFSWDSLLINKLLKEAWPLALANVFVIIYFRIDTVMLSLLVGDQPTAWYNAAYLLIFSLTFVAYILIMSVYPKLSQLAKSSLTQCRRLYRQTLYLMFCAGFLILGLASLLAKWLIPYFYGQQFTPAIQVFYVLALAVFFSFLSHVWLYTLNALGRQSSYALATGFGVLLNIILNFYWITKFSYIGAAWATVLTEIITGLIIFSLTEYYLYKNIIHSGNQTTPILHKPI
jgi:O-antigen/teichoic acid export membrane protein